MDALVSLTLPAGLESLASFSGAVVTAAREYGVADDRLAAIELALEEALVNIFSHALPGGKGMVMVVCRRDEAGRFSIRIEDDGPPFNPLEQEDPDTSAVLEERKVGGLGIFLIRRSMQRVDYRREGERNVLILTV